MSIGTDHTKSRSLTEATQGIVDAGCSVVVAASNDSGDACDYSPSDAVGPIVVGATKEDDTMYDFSNRGPCVSLLAPGNNIRSLTPDAEHSQLMSGTSMATPLVSGIAALYLSHPQYRGRTPADLLFELQNRATQNAITLNQGDIVTLNLLVYAIYDDSNVQPKVGTSISDDGSVISTITTSKNRDGSTTNVGVTTTQPAGSAITKATPPITSSAPGSGSTGVGADINNAVAMTNSPSLNSNDMPGGLQSPNINKIGITDGSKYTSGPVTKCRRWRLKRKTSSIN